MTLTGGVVGCLDWTQNSTSKILSNRKSVVEKCRDGRRHFEKARHGQNCGILVMVRKKTKTFLEKSFTLLLLLQYQVFRYPFFFHSFLKFCVFHTTPHHTTPHHTFLVIVMNRISEFLFSLYFRTTFSHT